MLGRAGAIAESLTAQLDCLTGCPINDRISSRITPRLVGCIVGSSFGIGIYVSGQRRLHWHIGVWRFNQEKTRVMGVSVPGHKGFRYVFMSRATYHGIISGAAIGLASLSVLIFTGSIIPSQHVDMQVR